MTRTLLSLMALTAAAAAIPVAARPPVGQPASIPFADHDGIRDFQADGSRGLYLQDRSGNWYRAAFFGACPGLNFTETIGYETDATGRFDKFSRIRFDHQVCALSTLVTADAPKGKKARHEVEK